MATDATAGPVRPCGEKLTLACDLPRGHAGPHWEDERPALRSENDSLRERLVRAEATVQDHNLLCERNDKAVRARWFEEKARADAAEAERPYTGGEEASSCLSTFAANVSNG